MNDPLEQVRANEAELRAENAGLHARLEKAEAALRAEGLSVEGGTDITAHQRAEAAGERYRLLSALGRDILLFYRPDGALIEVNAAAIAAYGYSEEELLAKTITDLRAPETHAELAEQIAAVRRGPIRFETTHVRRDGARFPVEASWTFDRIGGEEVILSVIRDITERKQAEEALQRTEQELRDFVENATVGMHWVGADGIILWANRTELQMLGYSREEYIGQHIAGFHADETVIQDILGRLTRDETLGDYEARLRCKDGSIRDVLINSNVLRENGKLVHTRCFTRDITERKRAEEAGASLAAIVESSEDAILSKDLDGVITSWNRGAERLYGYTAEEAIGQPVLMLIPADLKNEEPGILERIRKGETIGHYETVRCRKDRTRVAVSLTISPIKDTGGKIIGASKIVRDITERKRAEAALRESEERFRSLVSIITDVPWTTDAQGAFVVPQVAWEKYSGQSWEEHRGFGWTNALHPEDREAVKEIWEAAKQARSLYEARGRLWHAPSQQYRHFFARATRLFDAHGDVRAWVGTCTDCHDAKVAEEALRESEERFRAMADNIAPLAWMANPDGWIFFYNKRWYDYTGTTLEEMQGWGWEKVHHPDHLSRMLPTWKAALECGQPWEDTFPLRGQDGEYRWFLSRAFPIRDGQGKIVRWFGTNTDIHDQRRATEEIARASRAKDDFLAALSHELRTPLTPVLMTASALEGDTALPLEVRDQLGMIRRNVELQARLIDDLLDITRISRGKLNLAPIAADLHQLLEHTAEIVRSDELGKQVRVVFQLEAARPHALVDPTRMQQVFWNLIKNALKFTPTGGSITVRTRNDAEGWIVVSVEDSGVGISAGALPHVFRAFEQGDVAGQHRYGGLGLGLAISQAIVEAHGGAIHADSAGPGRGAIFTVVLATVDAPATPATPAHPASALPAPARGLRLLVVEDHEATRTVLSRLLTRSGHQVTMAGTIHEALLAFSAERFDAIISDLGLPDGSGLDLMREIQRQRPVPGIALSGYGMEDDLRQTKEAGFIAHLVKPVNFDQLRQILIQLSAAH